MLESKLDNFKVHITLSIIIKGWSKGEGVEVKTTIV
jgi:hypothetical protein